MRRLLIALAMLVTGCVACSSGSGGAGTSGASGPSGPSGPSGQSGIASVARHGGARSSLPPTAIPRSSSAGPAGGITSAAPRFAHVVVVIEENHGYSSIIGNRQAPYLNRLAQGGLSFTRSFGTTHPSQPNYLALFSGSTHGVTDDSCPQTVRHGNLGAQLRAAGYTFAGFAEGLPSTGYRGCTAGAYARKHVPWVDFPNLPGSVNRPLRSFPSRFAALPSVSFVVPDLDHDMHDGTIAQGDTWLRSHLGSYATWARSHRSLLLVTWDEDDFTQANRIPTIAYGAGIAPRRYPYRVDHYRVLRTLEALYHLPALGTAAHRRPIGALLGS